MDMKAAISPKKIDTTKQCAFPDDFWHNMGDFIALKYEVDHLLQQGHLRRFLMTICCNNTPANGQLLLEQSEPQMVRIVHVIIAGSYKSGAMFSAAKRSMCRIITCLGRPRKLAQ